MSELEKQLLTNPKVEKELLRFKLMESHSKRLQAEKLLDREREKLDQAKVEKNSIQKVKLQVQSKNWKRLDQEKENEKKNTTALKKIFSTKKVN